MSIKRFSTGFRPLSVTGCELRPSGNVPEKPCGGAGDRPNHHIRSKLGACNRSDHGTRKEVASVAMPNTVKHGDEQPSPAELDITIPYISSREPVLHMPPRKPVSYASTREIVAISTSAAVPVKGRLGRCQRMDNVAKPGRHVKNPNPERLHRMPSAVSPSLRIKETSTTNPQLFPDVQITRRLPASTKSPSANARHATSMDGVQRLVIQGSGIYRPSSQSG